MNFRAAFPNERIPTLEEMIQECLENDLLMFIDVKSNVAKVRREGPSKRPIHVEIFLKDFGLVTAARIDEFAFKLNRC